MVFLLLGVAQWASEQQDSFAKHINLLQTMMRNPESVAQICETSKTPRLNLRCDCSMQIFTHGEWKTIGVETTAKSYPQRRRRWRLETECKGFGQSFTLLKNQIVL